MPLAGINHAPPLTNRNAARVALIWATVVLSSGGTLARAQTTLFGYVTDAQSGERLIGASVYSPAQGIGTATDTYGYFTLASPADTVTLEFSYTGYVLAKAYYATTPAAPLDIQLVRGAELTTAEVIGQRSVDDIDERVRMSTVDIPMAQYKSAPVLLGEPDILKTLQLMPGVAGGTEGTAGLYVRGGSPDQNLILLDNVPVYNISHALGLFSVFNADAVQSVSLTKGGFPARFGGRLSSVLEVEMKDGPSDGWRAEGAVGLIASRLSVGGPIGEKTRVLVSARRTYFDVIAKPIIAISSEGLFTRPVLEVNFYDANLKVRHDINERHRLYLSGYTGGDHFVNGDVTDSPQREERFEEGVDWGNRIAALRWRWQLGPRAFLNTTASYSRYAIDYRTAFNSRRGELFSNYEVNYSSQVRDFNLKSDLTYAVSADHTLRFGGIATRHRYQPGQLRNRESDNTFSLDTTFQEQLLDANEFAAYVEHEWTVTDALAIDYGLHASAFDSDAQFSSLQPRISARYRLPGRVAVKASYATMTQFINLLTTESLSLPTDLWVPSTAAIGPQRSWQAALGVVKQLRADIELSAEAFYKRLDGVVSYRAGESFFEFDPQRSWQDKVTQGTGIVYGLELLAQRKFGKTSGWVGYTLSYNERQFAELNGGRAFPFRYDRRHDLSVLATRRFSERVLVSASFVFFTGNAYTLPQYRQYANFEIQPSRFSPLALDATPQAEARNQFRVSNSHRLDASVTLTKPKRWGERSWVFGVYNAYWHKNPVYVSAKDVRVPGTTEVKRQFREVSLLPIVPSVAYQFRFEL